MKKIAINFGDSDFHFTWTTLLKVLCEHVPRKELEQMSKARLVSLCNAASFGIYMLAQNRDRYGHAQGHKRTEEYLKITNDQVLFDAEVDAYAMETARHHRACFAASWENPTQPVYYWSM